MFQAIIIFIVLSVTFLQGSDAEQSKPMSPCSSAAAAAAGALQPSSELFMQRRLSHDDKTPNQVDHDPKAQSSKNTLLTVTACLHLAQRRHSKYNPTASQKTSELNKSKRLSIPTMSASVTTTRTPSIPGITVTEDQFINSESDSDNQDYFQHSLETLKQAALAADATSSTVNEKSLTTFTFPVHAQSAQELDKK